MLDHWRKCVTHRDSHSKAEPAQLCGSVATSIEALFVCSPDVVSDLEEHISAARMVPLELGVLLILRNSYGLGSHRAIERR